MAWKVKNFEVLVPKIIIHSICIWVHKFYVTLYSCFHRHIMIGKIVHLVLHLPHIIISFSFWNLIILLIPDWVVRWSSTLNLQIFFTGFWLTLLFVRSVGWVLLPHYALEYSYTYNEGIKMYLYWDSRYYMLNVVLLSGWMWDYLSFCPTVSSLGMLI